MRFPFSMTNIGRLVLSLVILTSGVSFVAPAQAQSQDQADLRQFDMLTASSGWVLLDQKLNWTSDTGQTWDDISPSMPPGALVQDVRFVNQESGWVLFTTLDPAGGARIQLAATTDGGTTWATRTLSLFEPGEIASYAERVEMDWFDSRNGWISVKQFSGSNFSLGTLFTTADGGETWKRFALPLADDVYFSDPQNGWVVGGPTGAQTYMTKDAGATWQEVSPASAEDMRVNTYTPFFSLDGDGLLVTTSIGSVSDLNAYRFDRSTEEWLLSDQVRLDLEPGRISVSILDAKNLAAIIPGTNTLVRMKDGQLGTLANEDGLSSSIVDLDMVSMDAGWAKSVEAKCATVPSLTDTSSTVNCASTTRFLHTTNGGVTWQTIALPYGSAGTTRASVSSTTSRATTMNSLSNLGNSQIYIGQGFDICEIPTLSQMQTWAFTSPYKVVNLYIGGSSRLCGNAALTSSYLRELNSQGWKFIPTWVGPQAPCTGYISRMSSDPTTAYNQGVAQANLAVDKLASLGLTFPDKTGSVVYYDIEYYGTNTTCRTAVNSFMNGWVSQIHTLGNLAGVYSSPSCNTGLSDFRSITNVPDVVWVAAWYYNIGDPRGTYDPTASVWDWLGSCMPSSAWANHQRIRQYSGDHTETWGGLSLEIDNDVLDGVVAMPLIQNLPPYVIPTARPTRERPVMRSQAMTPISLTTQWGTTSGSLSSLSLLNQSGMEDNAAAYVSFQTPNTVYSGYQTFSLPAGSRADLISTMLLQVNFKGPPASTQIWTWAMYDWSSKLWIKVGDSVAATPDQWNSLLFKITTPRRYISPGGEIRIQFQSNNSNGDAKVDYEAIHITYLSIPATPVPVVPIFTPSRPGVSSAGTSVP